MMGGGEGEEGEGEGEGEGGGFLWENESWAFSNSDDNSGGSRENPKPGGNKMLNKNKKHDDDEIDEAEAEEETRNSNSQKPAARETATGAAGGKRSNNNNNNDLKKKKKKGIMSGQGNLYNNEQGKGGTTTTTPESDHEMHIWTERERRKKMRSMFSSLHALLPQLPPKADKSTIVDEAVNYIKTLEQTVQKLEKQKVERVQGVGTVTTSICSYDPSQIKAVGFMESSREAFLADQGSTSSTLLLNHHHHHHQSSNSFSNFSRPPPPPPSPAAGAAVFRTWVSPNVILNVCGDNAHINVCCPKRLGLFTAITFFLEKNKLEVVSAQVSSDHYRAMFMIQVQVINGAIDQFSQSFSSVEEIFQQAAGEIMSYISSL